MIIPEFDFIPTVAVYTKRKNGKAYMIVTNKHVDDVNNLGARKPVVPHTYEIIELGVGKSFITEWCKKYKIKNFQQV